LKAIAANATEYLQQGRDRQFLVCDALIAHANKYASDAFIAGAYRSIESGDLLRSIARMTLTTSSMQESAMSLAMVIEEEKNASLGKLVDPPFDSVERAIAAIAQGQFVIVVDDESRENEGDLIIAADAITAESMAFMVRHTSGLVCVALPGEQLDHLQLPPMVQDNKDPFRTAFTISVDKRCGITTGISAADRAATIRALVHPTSQADDFVRPGHLFPLRARPGGVLERPGHTEAALDLTQLAGRAPGGVLCELVRPDGDMARRTDLLRFAHKHALTIITIAQLIAYQNKAKTLVTHTQH
jgi:3,4-dihydroxy-2-butanone 4-phosphate synthase